MAPIERIALVFMTTAAAAASAAVVMLLDRESATPLSMRPELRGTQNIEVALDTGTSFVKLQGRLPSAEPVEAAAPPEPQIQVDAEAPPKPIEVSLTEDETTDEGAADTQSWSAEVVTPPQPALPRVAVIAPAAPSQPSQAAPVTASAGPQQSVSLAERLADISPAAKNRLSAKFEAAKASWPPAEIGLVAIKDEKVLELHARSATGEWQFVYRYPILAASGTQGPKLRQGDHQVPEGIYAISLLNPNSKYHVSMRVDYPNAFDKEMAAKDGRANLGGDIMIHGKNVSIGCLAIGDEAAEELFVLAASIGLPKVKIVIAPTDFRKSGIPAVEEGQPKWLPHLYTQVASAMAPFKAPPSSGLLTLLGL